VQYLFVTVFLASCYPRLQLTGSAAVSDRAALLFMWLTAVVVTAPSRALMTWHVERRLLRCAWAVLFVKDKKDLW
jgi:hypothetical protein